MGIIDPSLIRQKTLYAVSPQATQMITNFSSREAFHAGGDTICADLTWTWAILVAPITRNRRVLRTPVVTVDLDRSGATTWTKTPTNLLNKQLYYPLQPTLQTRSNILRS